MGGGQGGRVVKAAHNPGRATVSKGHVGGAWDACWAWASSLGARSTGWVLAASRPPSHPPRVCRPRPGDLPLRVCHLCRGVQGWEGDPGPLAQPAACPDRGSDPYSGLLHPHCHRAFPSTAGPGPVLCTPSQSACPHPCSRPPASWAPSHSLACASPRYPRATGVSGALGWRLGCQGARGRSEFGGDWARGADGSCPAPTRHLMLVGSSLSRT